MKTSTPDRICSAPVRGSIALATLTLLATIGLRPALAQSYIVTDLGTLGGAYSRAFGINNRGMVVGVADLPINGVGHAFVWKPTTPNGTVGVMSDIGGKFFGRQTPTAAIAINDFPQLIADETDTEVFAPNFVWQDGATSVPLDAACWGINAGGEVAGWTVQDVGGIFVHTAILWKPTVPNGTNGTMVFLPKLLGFNNYDTEGSAINDYGQIIGYDQNEGGFLWTPSTRNGTNGSVARIGALGPGTSIDVPNAINNAGQIAGSVIVYDALANCFCDHAFLWTPVRPNGTSGTTIDLGVLSHSPDVLNSSYAYSLNSAGQIVGASTINTGDEHAFLWDRAHGMRDLNTLIPPNSGWELFEAWGINDRGQIAASGCLTNGPFVNHAILLTPVRVPRLASATMQPGGQFDFKLVGEAGRSYTIQTSTNLVAWTAFTNFVSATGTNQITDPAEPGISRRFYRAVTP